MAGGVDQPIRCDGSEELDPSACGQAGVDREHGIAVVPRAPKSDDEFFATG